MRDIGTAALNLQSYGGTHQELYNKNSTWVRDSARTLRHLVSPGDVERLLFTRRYWTLQAMGGGEVLVAMRYLLDAEIEERIAAFTETETWLRTEFGRWSGPGHLVVADTTVYNEHPQALEELEIDKIIGVEGELVHLILPMAVIDELDSLKRGRGSLAAGLHPRSSRQHPGTANQGRDVARVGGRRRLEDPDIDVPRGGVTVEIAFDPPDHTRLPITDEEIIDRTLAIQEVAGRPLTPVTFDTSQSTRRERADFVPSSSATQSGRRRSRLLVEGHKDERFARVTTPKLSWQLAQSPQ